MRNMSNGKDIETSCRQAAFGQAQISRKVIFENLFCEKLGAEVVLPEELIETGRFNETNPPTDTDESFGRG